MERSYIQLDDLPDEILLIILKKLHNCDVLYSLIGVNTRLDAIVNDATFTKNLTLISPVNKRFDTAVNDLISARSSVLITAFNGLSVSLTDAVLDRLCLQILPRINDKIQWLNVESSSMERILRTTSYPNIHTLGLYDLEPETAIDLFSSKIISTLLMISCIRKIYPKVYLIQLEFDLITRIFFIIYDGDVQDEPSLF